MNTNADPAHRSRVEDDDLVLISGNHKGKISLKPEVMTETVDDVMHEAESCPDCNAQLPRRLGTGRVVCSKCGWTDKPKIKNSPAPESSRFDLGWQETVAVLFGILGGGFYCLLTKNQANKRDCPEFCVSGLESYKQRRPHNGPQEERSQPRR